MAPPQNPYKSPFALPPPDSQDLRYRNAWPFVLLVIVATIRLVSASVVTYAVCIELRHGNLRWFNASMAFGLLATICVASHFIYRNSRYVAFVRFPPYAFGVSLTALAYTFGWLPTAI